METLVRHLADELAGFRRRALVAEARLKEIEASEGGAASLDLARRVTQLEKENERLELIQRYVALSFYRARLAGED